MLKSLLKVTHVKLPYDNIKCCSNLKENVSKTKFETVFTFPFIKYISVLNRLKVYQILGTSISIPGCGVLEFLNILPSDAFLSASYIGLTGTAVLSLASLPFKDVIGFIYVSEDNEKIKISSMNYWGKRIDREVLTEDWIPLLDLGPKPMDVIYLSPKLIDGTKYKLFIKFGQVLNSKKMGQVLE